MDVLVIFSDFLVEKLLPLSVSIPRTGKAHEHGAKPPAQPLDLHGTAKREVFSSGFGHIGHGQYVKASSLQTSSTGSHQEAWLRFVWLRGDILPHG